jgi:uncharacterized protein YbjT (DUF2867 family)
MLELVLQHRVLLGGVVAAVLAGAGGAWFALGQRRAAPVPPAPLAPPTSAVDKRVLVLPGTGRIGSGVCRALLEAGFDVYGTSRGARGGKLSSGAIAVAADYTSRTDVERALRETGAQKVVFTVDFFGAAKSSAATEAAHGRAIVAALQANGGVKHAIFVSVADADKAPAEVAHFLSKLETEAALKASGVPFSMLRPTCFFENLDDAANWNPLQKGQVKFLMLEPLTWVSTYDIGRGAAAMFKDAKQWLGKTVDAVAWQGDLAAVAKALERVGGVPVSSSLAMPAFLLRPMLGADLYGMIQYFKKNGGGAPQSIPAFKKLVPDAFGPDAFFAHLGKYSDGTKIKPA